MDIFTLSKAWTCLLMKTNNMIILKENGASSTNKSLGSEPILGGKHIKFLKRIIPKRVDVFKRGSIQNINKFEVGGAKLLT